MNTRIKKVLLLLSVMSILTFLLSGCVFSLTKPVDPYLVDRTEGWDPKIMLVVKLMPVDAVKVLDPNASVFWSKYIDLGKFDTRNLNDYPESINVTADLALMTADELSEIQQTADCIKPLDYYKPDTSGITLPLTAQGAFELSLRMKVNEWNGTTRFAATQGPFYVYYSKASNALFVVTNTYVQAFDVETGALLLMHSYGEGSLKRKLWGDDLSSENKS